MKRLDELKISPSPWKVIPYGESSDSKTPTNGDIGFANGEAMYLRDGGIALPEIADALLIAAAPRLYAALFDAFQSVCYNDGRCDGCAYASDCRAKPWRAALAEAAGESEVTNV